MIFLGFLMCLTVQNLTTIPPVEAYSPHSIHHSMTVEINPATHGLSATDTIHLPQPLFNQTLLSFALNPNLSLDRVEVNGQTVSVSSLSSDSSAHPIFTQWMVSPPLSTQKPLKSLPTMTVVYHGQIDDLPQASGGLRFVRPDKTNGHIGPKGVYLTSETFWYPTWEHYLVTFDLTLTLPSDWQVMTQGQEIIQSVKENRRTSRWNISSPTEALTMAANRFVVQKKPWRDIQLATYLFPDEALLAPQYLEATATYLELYTNLLGPYPFSRFSVVENFFPSGLGMPSFTLLGQRVIRRGYTQPYSLGHEIVHSWFGNSIFNDFAKGNWVEGLTTYLANYYYDEATGNESNALKTRYRMMHEYNLYATPEKDYPIRQFHHKETRIDNAVGYQKTALVFHMLRQKLGDAAFFKGIRQIVQEGTGQYIEWKDLEQVFSRIAKQDLTGFFTQWIEQPGAPSLTLNNLSIQPDPRRLGQTNVSGTLSQKSPSYSLSLPIQVNVQGQPAFSSILTFDQTSQPFTVNVPGIPTSVTLDPERHVLLQLQRGQLPPMLNSWATDTRRILVRAKTASKNEKTSLQALMQRVQRQSDVKILQQDSPEITEAASYLILGTPARALLASKALPTCDRTVQMRSERLTILQQNFEGSDMAFLITCPHPNFSTHTISLFFGLSPEAVQPVARLLFFYGWDSYLAFERGKVVARGLFQPVHSAREFMIPEL